MKTSSLAQRKKSLQHTVKDQEERIKNQFTKTKKTTVNVATMALVGGAAAYTGFKLIGMAFGKKKKKHSSAEPQIVYVHQPEVNVQKKGFTKTLTATVWGALLPILTNFLKEEGGKIAEGYLKVLAEKYKDQVNLDELIKRFAKK